MLLVTFQSPTAMQAFFDTIVTSQRFKGTAWVGKGLMAVIQSCQEVEIQSFLLNTWGDGHAETAILVTTPMFGQVVHLGIVTTKRECIRCGEDFTGQSGKYIEVDIDHDTDSHVICNHCIQEMAKSHGA